MAWMIVLHVGISNPEEFFTQPKISWLYGHLKVEFCPKTPKSRMRFDKVPPTFLNISGSFYVTNDPYFQNSSTFWWISNFWPPFWPQRPLKKNIFVLSIFSHLIWLQLVSGAKIRFYNIFVNYLEAPRGLRGHLEAIYRS